MKITNKFLSMLLVVGIAVAAIAAVVPTADVQAAPVTVAVAQEEEPAQPAELNAEFLAFLVAITGFFKAQFGLKGRLVLGVGFAIGLILYYGPLLDPSLSTGLNQFIDFVKWFLAGVGSFDTTVDAGAKISAEAQRLKAKYS